MKKQNEVLYGGIEGGGTKFVLAAGSGPENIAAMTQFSTTTPEETIGKCIEFFRKTMEEYSLAGIGIASFGPIDINKKSPTYGSITATPKPGWSNTDMVNTLEKALNLPVAFDTDTNVAGLGERRWGAAQGLDDFIYLTIGTGIGGGGMVNGKLMHGLVHPEMGHLLIPHDLEKDPVPGACPFHGDCLEGLASGSSMAARWGTPPKVLESSHRAWELEAEYLAYGVANLVLTLSPQRIIMGGGVMKGPGLLDKVRQTVVKLLNGYVMSPSITENINEYIVAPELGDLAGVLGAIALAARGSVE